MDTVPAKSITEGTEFIAPHGAWMIAEDDARPVGTAGKFVVITFDCGREVTYGAEEPVTV